MSAEVRHDARPLRADAVRNRERLVDVAREAFEQDGVDTSLEEIARRAGVGIGTLYRRFPSRDDLIEAVLSDQYRRLADLAGDLGERLPPAEALAGWMGAMMRYLASYRGLSACMKGALHDRTTALGSVCGAMCDAAEEILVAAQEAGTVRPDVTFREVISLASAIAWSAERVAEKGDGETLNTDVLLSIVANGLAPR
jgi:AcrR family transcriptional regulator